MANQATGSNGAADGHQQSIGAEDAQAIDGIAGSPAGTQQPSGADVDAGGAGAGPGQRHEEPVPSHPLDKGVLAPTGTPSGGVSGMSGQGVAQPRGATGVFGSHAQGRIAQFGVETNPMYAGNWTGAIVRGGKAVAVSASFGSASRQHSSGK